ncbi:MAG: ABC transporter permease [Sedimentisphaerales bacterium]|nr:ABC transporter permease [Sedimentisphaerales bacterium]
MSTLINDIKYGIRQLLKSPGFTLVAVLTLAIGISANVAIFSVVNAVLLRPLPFKNADRLIVVRQQSRKFGFITGFSYPDFLDWRQQNPVLEDFAAFSPAEFEMIEEQGANKINGAMVSGNFFSLLGVSACMGRTFTQADEQPKEPVAVISYDFWKSRFGQDKEALGSTVVLQDKVYTIIGVLPPGFSYPDTIDDAQIWTVLVPAGEQRTNRTYCWLTTVGRLKAGISIEQALLLLGERHKQLIEKLGMGDSEILIYGLRDIVVRGVRTTLWILYGVVGFILLVVCANVANLCLARVSTRDKEVAIRGILGADKLRLFRQFTTESILLSLAGGIVGLLITVWMMTIFRVKLADFVPFSDSIRIELKELLFGLGLCLLVGIVLGVTPFWLMQRCRLTNVLTERRSLSIRHSRFSNILISGQIAIALILSIGMGLMIRSMLRLSSADTGFNRDNLLTFNVSVRRMNEQQRYQFSRDFLERLTALPYVKSASTDSSMPCSPRGSMAPVAVDGYTPPDGKQIRAIYHSVGTDYFRTLQIPILRGRNISTDEYQKKERVAVINETLAKTFWPDNDPIGRELTFCMRQYRVIGVAADMIQGNVRIDRPNHLFLPFDVFTEFNGPDLNFVVRTASEAGAVIEQARSILRDIDSTLPLKSTGTFKEQMNKRLSQERFTTMFLSVFASIALLLIVIGIYGVVSYAVARRTREIGVRMALGAKKTNILSLILKQGLILLVIGLITGLAGAIGLTRFLSSYLYEINTIDPLTFILVPLLIIAVSILACFIPARRAAKIDPMEALRYE